MESYETAARGIGAAVFQTRKTAAATVLWPNMHPLQSVQHQDHHMKNVGGSANCETHIAASTRTCFDVEAMVLSDGLFVETLHSKLNHVVES